MKNLFFCLIAAALFISCNENSNVSKDQYGIEELEAELKSGKSDLGYEGCAVLVYPVEFSLPDGTTLTMNKEEEVMKRLREWQQNNPDSKQRPAMVFPVQMTFDGRMYTLKNESEMRRVRQACNAKKRIFYEQHKEELTQSLLEEGFEQEKIEPIVGVVVRELENARGKNGDYQIDDRLKQYLQNNFGLNNDELEKIRLLIIRLANR